jgi:hypothetical protein
MVIKGKEIFNFEKRALGEGGYKNWKSYINLFNEPKDTYIFEYWQYDSFTSAPTRHTSSDGAYLQELLNRDENNDNYELDENGEYPALCRIENIYKKEEFILNENIWEEVFK